MPKRKRVSKSGPIWHKSAEEATLDKMPKFNAHACGTGPHGDLKYNRAKQKRNWQRELDQRGARNCGPRPCMAESSPRPVEIEPGRIAETCGRHAGGGRADSLAPCRLPRSRPAESRRIHGQLSAVHHAHQRTIRLLPQRGLPQSHGGDVCRRK